MALAKCRECQSLISTSASACPSCGAKPRRKTSVLTWVVGGCFALLVINFVSNSVTNKSSPSSVAKMTPEDSARAEQGRLRQLEIITAKNAVTEQMKDPDSVRFGEVVNRAGTICGYVNAKNSLGGYSGEKAFMFDVASKEVLMFGQVQNFEKTWNTKCPAK
ncbi:hypothetical protein [Pseudomonas sp. RT6P73]